MKESARDSLKLLYRLTKNVVALTGAFSSFLVFFYVMGNFQGFQDSTQQIIISALSVSSIFFGLVSLTGVIESIIFFFTREVIKIKNNIGFLLVMILCLIISISFISISLVLGVVTKGI